MPYDDLIFFKILRVLKSFNFMKIFYFMEVLILFVML